MNRGMPKKIRFQYKTSATVGIAAIIHFNASMNFFMFIEVGAVSKALRASIIRARKRAFFGVHSDVVL